MRINHSVVRLQTSCFEICCTHIVCSLRWFALRQMPCLCKIACEFDLSVQISSLYTSTVRPPSTFFAYIPCPPPLVIVFATPSVELNEIVACVKLQCSMGVLQSSAPRLEVEQLDVEHTAQPLSTVNFNTISFSFTPSGENKLSFFEMSCDSLLSKNIPTCDSKLLARHPWFRFLVPQFLTSFARHRILPRVPRGRHRILPERACVLT